MDGSGSGLRNNEEWQLVYEGGDKHGTYSSGIEGFDQNPEDSSLIASSIYKNFDLEQAMLLSIEDTIPGRRTNKLQLNKNSGTVEHNLVLDGVVCKHFKETLTSAIQRLNASYFTALSQSLPGTNLSLRNHWRIGGKDSQNLYWPPQFWKKLLAWGSLWLVPLFCFSVFFGKSIFFKIFLSIIHQIERFEVRNSKHFLRRGLTKPPSQTPLYLGLRPRFGLRPQISGAKSGVSRPRFLLPTFEAKVAQQGLNFYAPMSMSISMSC